MLEEKGLERITADPNIMLGKPVIKGTRITVELVLELLSQGFAIEEILAKYKRLAKEDILACLTFAKKTIESQRLLFQVACGVK